MEFLTYLLKLIKINKLKYFPYFQKNIAYCDPLAVDGQITIGNVTLAEPYELTLHAAFLAGDGIGHVHLEVHFVVG